MKLFFSITTALVILSSCAVRNDYAQMDHQPTKSLKKIEHPKKKPISIEIKDERENKETVGYIQNSLGMKTAKIFPREEVSFSLLRAIQNEMIEKGFVITKNGLKLIVVLDKCYVDYESSIFSAKSIADLHLDIHVLNESDEPLYFKRIRSKGIESPIFLYSGKNASKALNKALKNALSELMIDQYFIGSLLGEYSSKEMIAQD